MNVVKLICAVIIVMCTAILASQMIERSDASSTRTGTTTCGEFVVSEFEKAVNGERTARDVLNAESDCDE